MIALYIVAGVLLLLAAILCLPVCLTVAYRGDLRLVLRVFGLPFVLYPKKEKPPSTRAYTPKKLKKRAKKQQKQARKQAKKQTEKAEKKKEKEKKKRKRHAFADRVRSAAQTVRWLSHLIGIVAGKFFSYLTVRVHKLHIAVATGDAAETALVYGASLAAADALLVLLQKAKRFRVPSKNALSVRADFCAQQSYVDVKITFSIRPYQVLAVAIAGGRAYLKHKMKESD